MSGNKLFADTNIILYLLAGDKTLATLLEGKNLYISFITQLELLGFYGLKKKDEKIIREFIAECTVVDINNAIKQEVIELRKASKIKLPDCIIAASSIYMDIPLISADGYFKKIDTINLLHYQKTV